MEQPASIRRKYRVGVIGCGRMGSTIDDEVVDHPAVQLPYSHAAAYCEIPEVELVAAADVNAAALTAFGDRWGVTRLYSDYRAMLDELDLDLVSVTTRATERARIIFDAIDAGVRAIFAEKALACSLEEADRIVERVEAEGVVLAVNCSRRWHDYYVKAEELIREGAVGKLLHVSGSCPGGMSHSGSHAIDVMRMFAGSDVEWVSGDVPPDKVRGNDDLPGNAYLRFASGATGFYNALSTSQVEFEALGTEGRIRCTANGVAWEYERFSDPWRMPVRHLFPRPQRTRSATVNAVYDILRCLEHGGSPRCSARDGRAALEIAVAVRESERRGGARVYLPLEDRTLRIDSR